MKITKLLRIISGIVIFLTLPTLLFFGFIYFSYNEDLPEGKKGNQADELALKMLDALDYDAYKKTNYIEWVYKNKRQFNWNKLENICTISWKEFKVELNLNDTASSKVYVHKFKVNGDKANELIKEAYSYFKKDSFWVIGPYQVFDNGVERYKAKLENKQDVLLVTYPKNNDDSQNSYAWILDKNYKPIACKMWTNELPIGGLEMSWRDWTTTQSGAQLPTYHEMIFTGIKINNIKGTISEF